MQKFSEQHRRWVANYFGGKVKELYYHLAAIVDACDESLRLFTDGQSVPTGTGEAVIYGFSSFANVIQTLKDAAKIVIGQQVPWSRIEQLRHGAFMRDARNAATHDGNPIISAWVDGRYFVPTRITRLDQYGELIEILPPREDIRTLCLEFAADFCKMLHETLREEENLAELAGSAFSIEELEEAISESSVMPKLAKQLFAANRAEIASQLITAKHDPVEQAIRYLVEVISYCESMQKN